MDHDQNLYSAIKNAASMSDLRSSSNFGTPRDPIDLSALLHAMRGRHSSNTIDKICSIAYPFVKRRLGNFNPITFPIYDSNTAVSVAWERLISTIASAQMDDCDFMELEITLHTPTIQLLCLFPHPSRHHWFPSWTQVEQYPDVSVRDNDPTPVAEDTDYLLRIVSGRIYHGCSLELIRPPTPKGKAAYGCWMGMDSETVELVATVPGIELNIDSSSTYVLVDISPDYSLWPLPDDPISWSTREIQVGCWSAEGHVHPPLWRESVVIVCKEVDNLAHVQPSGVTTDSLETLRYRLRRITTLKWNRDISSGPDFDPNNCWLPFKPSLEHMRSVACRADGPTEEIPTYPIGRTKTIVATFPCPTDVFCDPEADAGLPMQQNGRHEWGMCPAYEVYLV